MKVLVFDSGALINLSMNGLLYIIEDMKKTFDGKFIVPNQVIQEVYNKPLTIPRYELGAIRIKNLIDNKILESPEALKINSLELNKDTKNLMGLANNSFKVEGRWLRIVSDAEISCVALCKKLNEKGIDNILAIDERTTRMLCEKPQNLEKLMSKKLHKKVKSFNNEFKAFEGIKIIRSSELVYVAYKKDLIKIKDKKILEALLYATKYKGSSISFEEINILKRL